ncbi:restriction endonuclease [Endozoicomonas sp. SM1973]|uniref:Restriction endonuclease n=1 Tax=Spartinivicinus marinus TaxID=2994442 RepID=A0A853I775_9GAMM|nr:restriction endonuclease [Spartinivicinus marinus]MCX4025778.1 hypothetical protein [Spartinivicinus marinus]NYZ65771.1 restriction endonuclease [Spartinivicinus marinus]
MQILHSPQASLIKHGIENQGLSGVENVKSVSSVDNTKSAASQLPIQDVIFIGRGSSIAYALTEVCDRYEGQYSKKTLENDKPLEGRAMVIGSVEPWSKEVRGSGFINHQNELIDTWGDKAPKYTKEYANRQQFSDANTAQIGRATSLGVQEVNDDVKHVEKGENGLFKVTTKQGQEFHAKQIILGIGAGPHTNALADTSSAELTGAEQRLNNITVHDQSVLKTKVLDLDEFMRFTDNGESLKGKTVVVHGPNAGIDAVERAGSLGANIKWFIRSTPPVLLDGNQLEHAPKAAKESLVKVDTVSISKGEDGKVNLNFTHNNKDKTPDKLEADYYVYALGQDSEQQGAIHSVIDKSIQQELEPIYDIDQVYSDKPYETVLGIRMKNAQSDTGIVILGASVAQMAGGIQHTYLQQVEERIQGLTDKLDLPKININRLKEYLTDEIKKIEMTGTEKMKNFSANEKATYQSNLLVLKQELSHYQKAQSDLAKSKRPGITEQVENVVKTEVASVVVSPQLATVKASIGALTNIMPRYISEGETNYSSDNRTMLRVSLANDFPNIPESDAETFVKDVIDLRVMTKGQFQDKVMSDLTQYTKVLLAATTKEEALQTLTKLNVKSGIATRLVNLEMSSSYSAADREVEQKALKGEINSVIESGPIPAWGTPDHVRYGYASKLSDLNLGVNNQVPLSLFWLKEPINELNAIRV